MKLLPKITIVSVRLSLSAEDWWLKQFWTHGAQMLAQVLNATSFKESSYQAEGCLFA